MGIRKIERISIIYRREITWLKWFFLRDKQNPKKTVLEQKIYESFLTNKRDDAAFYVNLKFVTGKVINKTDDKLLQTIKKVYVYEDMNVVDACQTMLCLDTITAYNHLDKWFDGYFYQTYKYLLPIK
ncbi:hypothetical protein UG96_07450 [Streptococcus gallolyticus subsp. gallolyticus]|uniref:hypothetical protein n=1 Tax=Streptococcus gallolyticus TaxID=315405 RepID=UPI0005CE3DCC|nr:hypothetical protein [Streptococcus gallolyticus]KJE99184.1 hypothetical protein UG96_07450 [Streptococcus gallolyticus subsp. gallolyticus]